MQVIGAIIAFIAFTYVFGETHADDPVKIRHFLRALSDDAFNDLEAHLRNPFMTKAMLLAKVGQLNQRLPEGTRLSAYDFLLSLPCIVVGPIRELRDLLNDPTPGLKQFMVYALANFLNDELSLIETCELNRKGLMSLSPKEKQTIGVPLNIRADCDVWAMHLKSLDLRQSLNSSHPNALLTFGNGCLH